MKILATKNVQWAHFKYKDNRHVKSVILDVNNAQDLLKWNA